MSKEANSLKDSNIPEPVNPPIPHDPSNKIEGTNEISDEPQQPIKEDMNVLQEYYKGKTST